MGCLCPIFGHLGLSISEMNIEYRVSNENRVVRDYGSLRIKNTIGSVEREWHVCRSQTRGLASGSQCPEQSA